MSKESFYDVLLVDQNATLDEIKLAFKRRALQVHPDKGGSKEAFHLVYQALETLADSEARKKYDYGLATGKSEIAPGAKQGACGRKSAPRQQGQATPPTQARSRTEKSSSSRKNRKKQWAGAGSSGFEQMRQTPQSKQAKLLARIRDLLKQLPRDLRNDAISKHFSQRQRLILEKWMADQPSGVQAVHIKTLKLEGRPEDESCKTVSPPAAAANVGQKMSRRPCDKRTRRNAKRKRERDAQSSGGFINKKGVQSQSYQACVYFDALEMRTRNCDLQTTLEYLVILTAVKQKMRDPSSTDVPFEKRLQHALASSAKEHGKNLADLRIGFVIVQSARCFIGTHQLRTPTVRSIEKLGSIRRCLDPFRKYSQRMTKNVCWHPGHLQDALERFRRAVVDAWEIAGANSASILRKVGACQKTQAESREVCLLQWERGHMAMQDKNRHRPQSLREKNCNAGLEHRERRHMAMEDKNKHRPRKLKVKLGLQRCPVDSSSRKSMILRRLLVRWEKMLQREAQVVDKERRRVLRQRKAQRKKDQEERRRLELLHRKRLREEEKERRETLSKRMRSDLTMDEILGGRAGHPREENE
eukprot:Skav214123  [mRNA]  locus=scaffold1185:565764:567521:- [translate_table: standard]